MGVAVDFFVRQAGGEAVPLPAPVHNRAAGGSLSSGPWNKCLACGYDFDIYLFIHHILYFVTKGIAKDLTVLVLKAIAKLLTAMAYSQLFDRIIT